MGRDGKWLSFQLAGQVADRAPQLSGDTAVYERVLPGVDVRYRVLGAGVKEDLVLADASVPSTYAFAVQASAGVGLSLTAAGEVAAVDRAGRPVLTLPAPVVLDSAQPAAVSTEAVSYRLVEQVGGWLLTVVLDPAWLADRARVFPVLLDPTSAIAPQRQNTITGGSAAGSGAAGSMCVGYDGVAAGAQRTLLRFLDLGTVVPTTAQVLEATFGVFTTQTGSGPVQVQPRAVARGWDATATWNSPQTGQWWTTAGGEVTGPAGATVSVSPSSGYAYFPVTEIVSGWLNGSIAEHGLLLRRPTETAAGGSVCFETDTTAAANQGPFLSVRYVDRLGEVAAHTYDGVQMSERSVAKVNVFNGNLLVQARDVSLSGVGIDLDLTRSYNSLDFGEGADGTLATGWRLGLVDVKLAAGGGDGSRLLFAADGSAWRFARTGTTYTSPPGSNATLTDVAGGGWTVRYHTSAQTYHFNSFGFLTKVTDRNGNSITLTHPAADSPQVTSITDTRGRVTSLSYVGNQVTTITDPAGRKHTYAYSSDARYLLSYTDPSGATTTYSYDSSGKLRTATTPENRITFFEYLFNNLQYLTQVIDNTTLEGPYRSFTYNAGNTEVRNPNSQTTRYTFEPHGPKVSSTTDALGRQRSATYTPNDDVATTVDAMGVGGAAGNTTSYGYDSNNNSTSATLPTGAVATAEYTASTNCPNGGSNTYLPKCTRSADGNSTELTYDSPGNPISSKNTTSGGAAETVTSSYNPPAGSAAVCGGKPGQLCTVTDGRAKLTSYSYNTLGELTAINNPAPLGDVSMTYDNLSRISSMTDGKAQVTRYSYDPLDRITQTRFNNTTTCTSSNISAGTCITTGYDRDGNQLTQLDQTGTTSYSYDKLNRETSRVLPSTGATSVTYDPAGNTLTATDLAGTISYGYDAANQLRSLAEPGGSCTATPNVRCTRFDYDANGVRNKTTYPTTTPTVVTVASDNSNRVTQIIAATGSTTHTSLGYTYSRQVASTATDGALVRTRTGSENPASFATTTTTYAYDTLARLTGAVEKTASGATTASWLYCYDKAGNRTLDLPNPATTATCANTTPNTVYNDANQITSRAGSTAFSYDGNGAETAVGATVRTAGTWNPKGQLTSTTAGSTAVPFTYTGTGNKTRLTNGATSYRNTALGVTAHTTGGATTSYIREPNGALVAMRVGTASYYYLFDNLSSVIGLVNSSGNRANTYRYDPYGKARTTTQATGVDNLHRYTSGLLDASTGLTKLGIRYYDPALGRFTQPDPTGQDPHYTYARNNPCNFIDPGGAASGDLAAGVIGACTAGALVGAGVGAVAGGVGAGPGAVIGCLVPTLGTGIAVAIRPLFG